MDGVIRRGPTGRKVRFAQARRPARSRPERAHRAAQLVCRAPRIRAGGGPLLLRRGPALHTGAV